VPQWVEVSRIGVADACHALADVAGEVHGGGELGAVLIGEGASAQEAEHGDAAHADDDSRSLRPRSA